MQNTVRVNITLPKQTKEEIARIAEKYALSESTVMCIAIHAFLQAKLPVVLSSQE
jgi:antitoxin component of RelBE/YafQ-DinJ toxin-antitoxin module